MTYLLAVKLVNIRVALLPPATGTRRITAIKLGIDTISVFQITCHFTVARKPSHKFGRLTIDGTVMFDNFPYSIDDFTWFKISSAGTSRFNGGVKS